MPTLNKLEYLDETKQQIKNALNTNFNSQIQDTDTFRSYVSKINDIYTNWPKVTGEDTTLSLTPTKKGLMKVELKGNTSQDGEPAPDTPIPIKVVTGEQNVKIHNKNLFDKDNDVTLNTQASFNGTEDNEFTTSTSNIRTIIIARVPSNSEITLSINNDNYIQSRYFICQLKTPTTEAGKNERWYTGNSTMVTTDKTNYLGIVLDIKKNGTTVYSTQEAIDEMKFQIEEGSTPNSYVPYSSQTYPLSLGNIELAKIGNYKDYIFKNVTGSPYYNANLDLNDWYLHKEIGKRNINVSTITLKSDYSNIEYAIIPKANDYIGYNEWGNKPVIYTHALFNNNPSNWNDSSNVNKIYSGSERNCWWLGFTKGTGLVNIKSQLENSVIYYPLENSTNTKITDTTLIQQLENINNNARSYSDTTIIICSSESTDNEVIVANVSALMKGV